MHLTELYKHLTDLYSTYASMSFAELYGTAYNMVVDQLLNFNFAAVFALIGASFYVVTYYMKTMVPLRLVGIIANLFFLAYGHFYPSYPTVVLYLGILPLTRFRLIEMPRLIPHVRASSRPDPPMNW